MGERDDGVWIEPVMVEGFMQFRVYQVLLIPRLPSPTATAWGYSEALLAGSLEDAGLRFTSGSMLHNWRVHDPKDDGNQNF